MSRQTPLVFAFATKTVSSRKLALLTFARRYAP